MCFALNDLDQSPKRLPIRSIMMGADRRRETLSSLRSVAYPRDNAVHPRVVVPARAGRRKCPLKDPEHGGGGTQRAYPGALWQAKSRRIFHLMEVKQARCAFFAYRRRSTPNPLGDGKDGRRTTT